MYIADPITKVITAEVIGVFPEFHQAVCESNDGYHYSVVRKTAGIPWTKLKEGDTVKLEVFTALPIIKEVLSVNS